MAKKKKNGGKNDNKNGASSTSCAASTSGRRGPSPPPPSSTSPPPPPVGSQAVSEKISTMEKIKEWLSESSPELKEFTAGVMFASTPFHEASNPSEGKVIVYSDEMEKAHSITVKCTSSSHIKVSACDISNRRYDLLLSRNKTGFVLTQEWQKLVAAIDLKRGSSVIGCGFDKYKDREFRVLIYRKDSPPESGPEIFMFEKQMDSDDLDQVVIECCTPKLELAIKKTPWRTYTRVFATDAEGNRYEMSFARHGSRFTLRHTWGDFVAKNGVKEGDIVTATGTICGLTNSATLNLQILKKVAAEKSSQIGTNILFFEKKLEARDAGPVDRLMVGRCKDVVKAAVEEMLKAEGNHAGTYVRVSATDEEGRSYDLRLSRGQGASVFVVGNGWRAVVANNGLKIGDKVWFWGRFSEDGSIKMMISVDKALAA